MSFITPKMSHLRRGRPLELSNFSTQISQTSRTQFEKKINFTQPVTRYTANFTENITAMWSWIASIPSRVTQYAKCLWNGQASIRLSVPSIDSGVRRVCCWAPSGQEISTDSRRRRSAAANAGSVTMRADGGGWTETWFFNSRPVALLPDPTLAGGSVAEWLACWTQTQKSPCSNRSRDAVR